MAQRKRKEPPALVKQSRQTQADEAVYERPTTNADVIFDLVADVSPKGLWLKLTGRAPAGSQAGHNLSLLPICAILLLSPVGPAAAGFFFVQIPLVTAALTLAGFGGGMWVIARLTGNPHASPQFPAVDGRVVPPPAPSPVMAIPQESPPEKEPEQEAGTPSP